MLEGAAELLHPKYLISNIRSLRWADPEKGVVFVVGGPDDASCGGFILVIAVILYLVRFNISN